MTCGKPRVTRPGLNPAPGPGPALLQLQLRWVGGRLPFPLQLRCGLSCSSNYIRCRTFQVPLPGQVPYRSLGFVYNLRLEGHRACRLRLLLALALALSTPPPPALGEFDIAPSSFRRGTRKVEVACLSSVCLQEIGRKQRKASLVLSPAMCPTRAFSFASPIFCPGLLRLRFPISNLRLFQHLLPNLAAMCNTAYRT